MSTMNIFYYILITTIYISSAIFYEVDAEQSADENAHIEQKNDDENSQEAVFYDKEAITEISLGNAESEDSVEIYISPSCLHCANFITSDLEKFIKSNGSKYHVILKFLPTTAKDFFIMKLIQNETNGDESAYYAVYKKYIKRTLATINHVKPTQEQTELYKGSNTDPEMIKFQVVAAEFGFSDEKILNAIPDSEVKAPFERTIMLAYSNDRKALSKVIQSNELDLPLIVKNGKAYKKLKDLIED